MAPSESCAVTGLLVTGFLVVVPSLLQGLLLPLLAAALQVSSLDLVGLLALILVSPLVQGLLLSLLIVAL